MKHWQMPVRASGVSAFGLCGGIAMEAAPAGFYRAPGRDTGLARPTRIPNAPGKSRVYI